MNDKFCDTPGKDNCYIAGNNIIKDILAELDSEDASSHGNFFQNKKNYFCMIFKSKYIKIFVKNAYKLSI